MSWAYWKPTHKTSLGYWCGDDGFESCIDHEFQWMFIRLNWSMWRPIDRQDLILAIGSVVIIAVATLGFVLGATR